MYWAVHLRLVDFALFIYIIPQFKNKQKTSQALAVDFHQLHMALLKLWKVNFIAKKTLI